MIVFKSSGIGPFVPDIRLKVYRGKSGEYLISILKKIYQGSVFQN